MTQYNDTHYINNGDYRIQKFSLYPQDVTHIPYPPSTRWEGKYQFAENTMIYVENGEFLLSINKKVNLVKKQELVLLPKNMPCMISMKFSKNLSFYHIHLRAEINDIDWSDFFCISDDNYIAHVENYERLEECLHSARRDSDFTSIEAYHLNRISKLSEIMAFFLESSKNNFVKIGTWQSVITFMEENIHKEISVKDLAACVQFHPNYFIRKFKEDFGVSPMKYFDNIRIKKALELISQTDKSFFEIASSIGINDPYYFSTFFKERVGMSPKKFRMLYLEMINNAKD
ncbi:MAG: helix-turn-helix transcriptional regulator [Clostridia bacterium]|nr:helix-turn-helix transcriptional regulator [Clostridia bacterium]